ncbi:MAG: hypothetical protein QM820_01275 [Minicystis sp.]
MGHTEPLVGREADLAALSEALLSDASVVTLTGPVGVGKSRLAEAALREAARDRAFEATLAADVADVTSLDGFLARTARALGLAASEDRDAARESRRIGLSLQQRGQALFLIDGLDAVLGEAAGPIAEWLGIAPEARIFVTSRARLQVDRERVIELRPLAAPRGDALDGPAARYFLACARRTRPDFAPAPAEAAFVAEIVRELDGLPLALELAAPRLAVMGSAALLHRLRASRSMLRARTAGAEARRASFDAAVEGSWVALHPWERDALTMLAVFAGFSIDDAEAVVDLSRYPQAPPALEVIHGLCDKSLVSAEEVPGQVGERRLRLLASVADFVRRRGDAAVLEAARARHAAHYGALARRWCAEAPAAARETARRVDGESDNLLAVIRRVLAAGPVRVREAEPALWALLALAPGLDPHPSLAVHAALLDRVLDATQSSGADPRLLARAFGLRGAFRRQRGDLAAAARDLGRGLHLARMLGAAEIEGVALVESSQLVAATGDVAAAAAEARLAVSKLGAVGARGDEVRALLALGDLEADRGDLAAARAIVERALALAAALALPREEQRARLSLAGVKLDAGARDEARDEIGRARAAADAAGLPACDVILGLCLLEEGDLRAAAERCTAGAAAARRLGLGAIEARALLLAAAAAIERRAFAEAYAHLTVAMDVARGGARALAQALRGAVARLDADRTAMAAPEAIPPGPPLDRALSELAQAAGDRPSFEAARARVFHPASGRALGRVVLRALERAHALPARAAAPPSDALLVGPEARWFRAPGAGVVSLARRRPLSAIVEHLFRARRERAGVATSWDALLGAGWPGERMAAAAGAHRVRVAVSTLRKLGLRALLTASDGYLLDPGCPVLRAEDDGGAS